MNEFDARKCVPGGSFRLEVEHASNVPPDAAMILLADIVYVFAQQDNDGGQHLAIGTLYRVV